MGSRPVPPVRWGGRGALRTVGGVLTQHPPYCFRHPTPGANPSRATGCAGGRLTPPAPGAYESGWGPPSLGPTEGALGRAPFPAGPA